MIRAVLWDMDGLLVDTEPLWTVAEDELCTRLGGQFTADMKAEMVGHRLDSAIPILLHHLREEAHVDAEPEVVATWLLSHMVDLFASGDVQLMPGAADLLSALATDGVPCALVSSSYRVLVDAALTGTGLTGFAVTVAGDEVVNAKPHPEPYATAARLLDVDPADCLVLEDSAAGMRSGIAAGCRALLVPSVAGVADVGAAEGWPVVTTLDGLSPAAVFELVMD